MRLQLAQPHAPYKLTGAMGGSLFDMSKGNPVNRLLPARRNGFQAPL
jgi:hypothetical protein